MTQQQTATATATPTFRVYGTLADLKTFGALQCLNFVIRATSDGKVDVSQYGVTLATFLYMCDARTYVLYNTGRLNGDNTPHFTVAA